MTGFNLANKVKSYSDCLIVIGIGGSFLGSMAVNEALKKYFDTTSFPIIYAGTTFSSEYLNRLINYLKDKDYTLNVISKSGSTLETKIAYDILKNEMQKKYSKEEMQKRIIVTTDKEKGPLKKEADKRFSMMTPAHLFSLAFNNDIKSFVKEFNDADFSNDAYNYALTRVKLFNKNKFIENYCIYEEKLFYFTEWLKQLFGESEGKNNLGIFPVSTLYPKDLHSLGQFIQEGNKILFETIIKVQKSSNLIYKGKELQEINNIVLESVKKAHEIGNVYCNKITIDKIDAYNLGALIKFFMLSASYSAILFKVDPFNQPGVEIYKKEVKDNLKL